LEYTLRKKYYKCRDITDEEVTIVLQDTKKINRRNEIIYYFFGCDVYLEPKDFYRNYTLLDEILL